MNTAYVPQVTPLPKPTVYRSKDTVREYRTCHPYCQLCGAWGTESHHIRSRGAGGSDDPANLLALCHDCHMRVHAGNISREEVRRAKEA